MTEFSTHDQDTVQVVAAHLDRRAHEIEFSEVRRSAKEVSSTESADSMAEPAVTPAELHAKITRLRRELAASQRKNAQLEARLREVLSGITSGRGDLTPIEAIRHADIARDFQVLVEQDIQHLVHCLPRSIVDRSQTHWAAKGVSAVCSILFASTPTTPAAMLDTLHLNSLAERQLVREIYDQVMTLREAAATNSRDHTWDFTSTQGEPVNSSFQIPWGSCDPQQPVWFVVSPAYVADGDLYGKQQVYTSWAKSEKRGGFRNLLRRDD